MRRVRAVTVAGLLLAACAALTTAPGGAKAPGANGEVVFSRKVPALNDVATFVVNADGSNVRRLFPGASGAPHWSPDGSTVALTAGGNASVLVNPDTGSYRVLKRPDPSLDLTACFVWSPDAKRLACDGQSNSDPSRNGLYTILAATGQGLTRVTAITGGEDYPFDYSPDGTKIVFSRLDPGRPDNANDALFVVNVDGSGLHQITPWGFPDRDDGGSWSPDGSRILFSGIGESGSLYTVHPDGGSLTKVPLSIASSLAHDPGWSPDGTRIVFNLFDQTTQQQGLYTANPDGTNLRRLTRSPTFDGFPDWGSHPAVAARCLVPHVVGLTLARAKVRIRAAHCAVGRVTRRASSKRHPGKVLAQSPKAGTQLGAGRHVNLVVGAGA